MPGSAFNDRQRESARGQWTAPQKLALILGALAFLAACGGPPETMFVQPDDCFDPAMEDHPAYVDSCGNEQ